MTPEQREAALSAIDAYFDRLKELRHEEAIEMELRYQLHKQLTIGATNYIWALLGDEEGE